MTDYHLNRAHQLYKLNRYEQCYQEAQKALQYDIENERVYFLMLLSLINLKKYDEAETLGQTALSYSPDSDELLFTMGVLYNNKDDYPKARKHLEAAIQINPENSQYFFHLAKSHLGFNQIKIAKRLLDRSLYLNPNNESALQLLSLIEQETASSEDALRTADKALQLSPEDAYAHFVKASLHWKNKDFPNAEAHLKTAVELDPQNEEILALWFESRTRNLSPWNTFINFLMGKNRDLLRPTLILGFVTFLPSVLISNEQPPSLIIWIIIGLLMIPILVFWWVRPFLKFRFLNKKINQVYFEMANPSLPFELLASLNILSSVIYWISGNGLFFGIAFLSTLLGGGIAQWENIESIYPVYNKPLRIGLVMITAVVGLASLLYLLNKMSL